MFGGGQADLVLLEEDILTAGMAIEARLPEKRCLYSRFRRGKINGCCDINFCFFLTQPAPFCLLDEVDAALDDSNTTKLSTLCRTFKKNTIYFITHNKISMEIADQLIGVTMREPGLSDCLVDIESASHLQRKTLCIWFDWLDSLWGLARLGFCVGFLWNIEYCSNFDYLRKKTSNKLPSFARKNHRKKQTALDLHEFEPDVRYECIIKFLIWEASA